MRIKGCLYQHNGFALRYLKRVPTTINVEGKSTIRYRSHI